MILTTCLLTILIGMHAKITDKPTATQATLQPTDTLTTDSIAADSIPLPPQEATMLFDRQEYHMGRIWDSSKPATYTFFYCNVGLSGLIINRIETTCGCQVLQYPTDSLYYDQSGQIEVAISPCSDKREFKKGIYVYTNAGTFKLLVSGEFNKPNYSHEDYSAIPKEEDNLLGTSTSSVTKKDESSVTEDEDSSATKEDKRLLRKKKKEKRKKKH